MSDLDDRALTLLLDGDDPPLDEPELQAAFASAERDLERIRIALFGLAEEHPGSAGRRRRRRTPFVAAGLAVAAVAALAVVLASTGDDGAPALTAAPVETVAAPAVPTVDALAIGIAEDSAAISVEPLQVEDPNDGPANPGPSLGKLSVAGLVEGAEQIVVGTVTAVEHGTLPVDGAPYVLATVTVEESLKPAGAPVGGEVVAFDYDLGGELTSEQAAGDAELVEGARVLLFLGSDAGTVSADLAPAHLQVMGGPAGRYAFVDGVLQAPFAIEEIRAEAG